MPAAVLNYNASHELVTQETYYNCGPGSCQLVLDARGITVSEDELSAVLGTTVNGTPSIDNIAKGLNHYDGASQYASMWMANDPPTADEVNLMRERIFRTIAWGRGCVADAALRLGGGGDATAGARSGRPRAARSSAFRLPPPLLLRGREGRRKGGWGGRRRRRRRAPEPHHAGTHRGGRVRGGGGPPRRGC
jgi:hypothetical protein